MTQNAFSAIIQKALRWLVDAPLYLWHIISSWSDSITLNSSLNSINEKIWYIFHKSFFSFIICLSIVMEHGISQWLYSKLYFHFHFKVWDIFLTKIFKSSLRRSSTAPPGQSLARGLRWELGGRYSQSIMNMDKLFLLVRNVMFFMINLDITNCTGLASCCTNWSYISSSYNIKMISPGGKYVRCIILLPNSSLAGW